MTGTFNETHGGTDEVLARVFARYPGASRDALIPILQDVQAEQGHLSRAAVIGVARHLGIATSKVYGVATFYNQFRFNAAGRYHIQVCRGTACHVKGSLSVLDTVRRALRLEPGQTSRDGMWSLEVVACIGACGLAPVMAINGEFCGGLTTDSVTKILSDLRAKEETHV